MNTAFRCRKARPWRRIGRSEWMPARNTSAHSRPGGDPWGPALRHERLCNGLFWLETAQAGWVLAIAYPLCSELFEETLDRAALTEHDRAQGIPTTPADTAFTPIKQAAFRSMRCCPLPRIPGGQGSTLPP